MPYYWSRISNTYEEAPAGWTTDNKAIVADLAWYVIEDHTNPVSLMESVQNAYDNDEDFRAPHPDENGLFKKWFDEILVSEASIGYRDKLMAALFCGNWNELNDGEASYFVHMLPCETIKGFIEHIITRIKDEIDELASADTQEIMAHDELEDSSDSDSDSDRDSDSDSDDEEDYDSMPELLEDSEGEPMDIDSDSDMDIDSDSEDESNQAEARDRSTRRRLF